MGTPQFLRFYNGLVTVAAPLWRLLLKVRTRKGLENPARVAEKLGSFTVTRTAGPMIWFHAVSVGESLALLTMFRRLQTRRPDLSILLTTSTFSSEKALSQNALPPNVIHQYAPIDTPGAVSRFLAYWHPDALVIAEADLWPTMMTRTAAQGIPITLLNATLTEKSYRARLRAPKSYAFLIGLIDKILVQDLPTVERFVKLGAERHRIEVMGVLKSASDALPDRSDERAEIEGVLGDRPRWLAAATREDEDRLMIEAHAIARQTIPDLLLILAPRQITQADNTEAEARKNFSDIARRSRHEPITPDTQVYIADTIGEMGLWYRLSRMAFLGHSLSVDDRHMTGKNPFEALQLDCVVVHGPSVDHFHESYARLQNSGAARQVESPADLAQAVIDLQDPAQRAPYLAASQSRVAANMEPLKTAIDAIEALLD